MKILLVFSAILTFTSSQAQNKTVDCDYMRDSHCQITGETLTLETRLIPRSYTNVYTFTISSSTFPRLTSSICATFPNLNKIVASSVLLEVVDEDAFVRCVVIKEIRLNNNYIFALKPNTFNRNPTLETLDLGSIRLQRIDDDFFANLTKLTYINLDNNNISYFPSTFVRDLQNLKKLHLNNNPILLRWLYADNPILDLDKLNQSQTFSIDWVIGNFEEAFKDLRADINKTKKELAVAQTETGTIKQELNEKINKNEQDIKSMESVKAALSKVEDDVSGLAKNTIDLSELLKKVELNNNVISNDVNENRLKSESISKKIQNFEEAFKDLRADINETKTELEVAQIETVTIKEELNEKISKNDLSELLKKMELSNNVLSNDVNENRLKIESISSSIGNDLANLHENLSSMKVAIDTNHKVHGDSMTDQSGSITGLRTYIIVLTFMLVAILGFAGIMIHRFFTQMLIVRENDVEMKSDLDKEKARYDYLKPCFM